MNEMEDLANVLRPGLQTGPTMGAEGSEINTHTFFERWLATSGGSGKNVPYHLSTLPCNGFQVGFHDALEESTGP